MSDDVDDGEDAIELAITHTLAHVRVDRALAMISGRSRADVANAIAAGAVSLDGQVVTRAATVLRDGQQLRAVLDAPDDGAVAPDDSVEVDVVLEDEDFVVVNKRPGQVVHPGAGHRDHTLVAGLLARYPQLSDLVTAGVCEPGRPGVVHRLDKGTSGLLVVATSELGFRALSAQLGQREVERTYLGLVEGHVVEERGVVDAPLGRSNRSPTMMSVRSDGRAARTGYTVLDRYDKPTVTLLRLQLETGRTHQIRVHLATIGHPIVNDARYGHRRDRRLDPERFFLHSTALTFEHPRSGARVSTSVALPGDLAALVPSFRGP